MATGRPPKAPKITRKCKQCGKKWKAYPWDKNRLSFCSHACFSESQRGQKRELVEREERACLSCGKIFLVGGAENRKRISKYCSRSCARHGIWGDAQHSDAKKMNRDERIWFAAILDGEGCIGWPRRSILHSVYLSVTNTNKQLIDRVSEVTGTGRIKLKERKERHHSTAWTWACYGKNSLSILRQILPWLIVKREAAEAALGLNGAIEPPWTQRSRSMRAAE